MIVGLSGYKGSGKDTAADYLISKYGFKRLSFADKLKVSAAALFNIDPDDWNVLKNDPEAKITLEYTSPERMFRKDSISARLFLQRYGTQSHRMVFGDNFWIEEAFKGLNLNEGNYVIPDTRFTNEIEAIKRHGGVIARILRSVEDGDSHESEIPPHPSLLDYYIDNEADFDNLYDELDAFVLWLKDENLEEEYEDKYGE